MLRLILRQIRKHWIALLLIVAAWAVALYFILPSRNRLLARVSQWVVRLPKAGRQDPVSAYRYVESARARLTEGKLGWFCRWFDTQSCLEERRQAPVRLDLMEKACRAVPRVHHGEPDVYRAHWLERRQSWNLTPEAAAPASAALVEPSPYWKENRQVVLSSLKDLLDASSYAYEIQPEQVGRPKGEMILVPRLFEEHARALCWDVGGALMWGDYIAFQEERALLKLQETIKDFDRLYLYPDEQLLARARILRGDSNYELALRRYLGARPPAMGDPLGCRSDVFRLSCVAPLEAPEVFRKLLLVLASDRMHSVRYQLGLLYFLIGRREEKRALERAVIQFEAAATSSGSAPDARKNLVRIYLHTGRTQEAYAVLRELHLTGVRDPEFRTLARAVLFHMGRFRDADCFSEEAGGLHGPRAHCKSLQL